MYPYTNMHEMNLDWILEVIEEFKNGYITRDEVIRLINERVPEIANTLYSEDGNKALSAKMGSVLRGTDELLELNMQNLTDNISNMSTSLGPVYREYNYYTRGQVVVGPDWRLYMCTVNTAHGDWDPTQWQLVDLTTLIARSYRDPVLLYHGDWVSKSPLQIPLPDGAEYDKIIVFTNAPRGTEYEDINVVLYNGNREIGTFNMYHAVSNTTNARVKSYIDIEKKGEILWVSDMVNGTANPITSNRRVYYKLPGYGLVRDTIALQLTNAGVVADSIEVYVFGRVNNYNMSNNVDDDVESGGVMYDLSEE